MVTGTPTINPFHVFPTPPASFNSFFFFFLSAKAFLLFLPLFFRSFLPPFFRSFRPPFFRSFLPPFLGLMVREDSIEFSRTSCFSILLFTALVYNKVFSRPKGTLQVSPTQTVSCVLLTPARPKNNNCPC